MHPTNLIVWRLEQPPPSKSSMTNIQPSQHHHLQQQPPQTSQTRIPAAPSKQAGFPSAPTNNRSSLHYARKIAMTQQQQKQAKQLKQLPIILPPFASDAKQQLAFPPISHSHSNMAASITPRSKSEMKIRKKNPELSLDRLPISEAKLPTDYSFLHNEADWINDKRFTLIETPSASRCTNYSQYIRSTSEQMPTYSSVLKQSVRQQPQMRLQSATRQCVTEPDEVVQSQSPHEINAMNRQQLQDVIVKSSQNLENKEQINKMKNTHSSNLTGDTSQSETKNNNNFIKPAKIDSIEERLRKIEEYHSALDAQILDLSRFMKAQSKNENAAIQRKQSPSTPSYSLPKSTRSAASYLQTPLQQSQTNPLQDDMLVALDKKDLKTLNQRRLDWTQRKKQELFQVYSKRYPVMAKNTSAKLANDQVNTSSEPSQNLRVDEIIESDGILITQWNDTSQLERKKKQPKKFFDDEELDSNGQFSEPQKKTQSFMKLSSKARGGQLSRSLLGQIKLSKSIAKEMGEENEPAFVPIDSSVDSHRTAAFAEANQYGIAQTRCKGEFIDDRVIFFEPENAPCQQTIDEIEPTPYQTLNYTTGIEQINPEISKSVHTHQSNRSNSQNAKSNQKSQQSQQQQQLQHQPNSRNSDRGMRVLNTRHLSHFRMEQAKREAVQQRFSEIPIVKNKSKDHINRKIVQPQQLGQKQSQQQPTQKNQPHIRKRSARSLIHLKPAI